MPYRVLVVDDDPSLLQGIRDRLHGKCEVVVAKSGTEALARLAEDPPFAVIVSDFRMPGMDGIELLSKVREQCPNVIRVMLTGHADVHMAAQAINSGGVFKMLLKPCLNGEIESALEGALAQHQAQVEKESLALEDHLLGIGNRRAFDKALLRTHGLAVRYRRSYGLAMVDVDRFKQYNDCYGHLAGDHLLTSATQVVRATCRGSDEAFRYGGDEIILLFPDTPSRGVLIVCERFRQSVESLCIPHAAHVPPVVTVSIGAACFDVQDATSPQVVLQRADLALYQSKEAGRNRVTLWDDRTQSVAS